MNNLHRYLLKTTLNFINLKGYIRNYARKDPGISKRSALLEDDLNHLQIDEEFDDLEADFFDVGKSYKQHNRELEASKELQKYHIVKQKYFNEKFPNFLTWADKQQIKFLHQSDGEEWTIERLSEGFPALPDTIQKIIKNNWSPKNVNRVKRHDEAVQENWKNFKNKKLNTLPAYLSDHLDKFTSRELNLNPNFEETNVSDLKKRDLVKKGGEFSSIIESYQKLKAKSMETSIGNHSKQLNDGLISSENASSMPVPGLTKNKSEKMLTYSELQREIGVSSNLRRKDATRTLSITHHNDEVKEITLKSNVVVQPKKFQESQVNLYKPKRDYSSLVYPERIKIPADKRKRGYTYKLNDCFYDADGEFLYRVPGMC